MSSAFSIPTMTKRVNLTNLVPDGSFEDVANNWICWLAEPTDTSQAKDGACSLKLGGDALASTMTAVVPINGHKYYGREYIKTAGQLDAGDCRFEMCGAVNGAEKAFVFGWNRGNYPNWTIISDVITVDGSYTDGFGIRTFTVGGTVSAWVDSIVVIDLTAACGAGNEPSKEWCDANIPFFSSSYTLDIPVSSPILKLVEGLAIPEGNVVEVADAQGNVLWSANKWPDDLDTGLEFTSESAFSIAVASPGWDGTIEYCNGEDWVVWDGSEISSGKSKSGQSIYIRGTGNTKVTGKSTSYKWTLTGNNIACNGNIEKLLDYATVKAGNHPLMSQYCYAYMFWDCPSLTTAPALPATTLADYCYSNMFNGCHSLTTAPALPATTLATRCYYYMFDDCPSLTTAPALPATTLATRCYACMFNGCTSLTTAPALPATTLALYCYYNMFGSCTSLTTVPALPATTLANYCYYYMFDGCTSIKLSETKTSEYPTAYRIPTSGTGTTATNAFNVMFRDTGGTFTGNPVINTTYYLHSSNTIV